MKEREKKRSSSWDLYAVAAMVLLAVLFMLTPPLDQTPVRRVLGLALTLFLPGYALISTLFPGKKGLGLLERVALSFGLSIAATPLLGLVLNYTPFGIRKDSVLVTLSLFTLLCTAIALYRRKNIKGEESFSLLLELKASPEENKLDKALTILLILSIVISLSVLVYVIVTPKQGEKFTEFYILGPNAKAENYPTSMKVGNNGTVIIGVVNHEYEQINYTLKILLGNESIRSQRIPLHDNQSYSAKFSFTPVRNGTEKLSFQLYRNDSIEPYRSLHLWVKTG